jgi:hypothetical protein
MLETGIDLIEIARIKLRNYLLGLDAFKGICDTLYRWTSRSILVHAIQAGSVALNNGNNATCAATDQRGVARLVSGTCDIGAFEGVGTLLYLPPIIR